MKPAALLFDWDSTLVDNWNGIASVMTDVRAVYGLPPVDRLTMIGLSKLPHDEIFTGLFEKSADEARLRFYSDMGDRHVEYVTILPRVTEALDLLSGLAIPMAVASNKKGDMLRREIAYLGWEKYFATAVGGGDAARDKPAAAPLLMALKSLDIQPDASVWMVGDTVADMESAHNAGITPVLVTTTESLGLGIEGNLEQWPPAFRIENVFALGELVNSDTGTI